MTYELAVDKVKAVEELAEQHPEAKEFLEAVSAAAAAIEDAKREELKALVEKYNALYERIGKAQEKATPAAPVESEGDASDDGNTSSQS